MVGRDKGGGHRAGADTPVPSACSAGVCPQGMREEGDVGVQAVRWMQGTGIRGMSPVGAG